MPEVSDVSLRVCSSAQIADRSTSFNVEESNMGCLRNPIEELSLVHDCSHWQYFYEILRIALRSFHVLIIIRKICFNVDTQIITMSSRFDWHSIQISMIVLS